MTAPMTKPISHYLPFLSILGAQRSGERRTTIVDGDRGAYDLGMFSFAIQ